MLEGTIKDIIVMKFKRLNMKSCKLVLQVILYERPCLHLIHILHLFS